MITEIIFGGKGKDKWYGRGYKLQRCWFSNQEFQQAAS